MSAAGWEWGCPIHRVGWPVRSPSGSSYAVRICPPNANVGVPHCRWVVVVRLGGEMIWYADAPEIGVGPDVCLTFYQPPRRQVERAIERWERERACGGAA